MRCVVLGCGTVGSTAAMILAKSGIFSDIYLGDANIDAAKRAANMCNLGDEHVFQCNASDVDGVVKLIRDFDVVLNCIGPFYEYGPKLLKAAIKAGVNYVDICDDYDATVEQLKMDEEAKRIGVKAVIGMGSSPGLANLLAKYAAQQLLDEVEAIDIYHAHGGEPTEGAAVVKHRIHSMEMDIPVFLDGEFRTVKLFEESGRALEEEFEFPVIGKYWVYAYPHPETITLPRYIKVKRVTNLGLVLPPEYAELIKTLVRIGMTSSPSLKIGDVEVDPLEFAVAFILHKRGELLKKAGLTEPVGCVTVAARGKKNGKTVRYYFSLASKGMGMGEGTGIPAAIGALLMGMGRVNGEGVMPPEACIDPMDALQLAQRILQTVGVDRIPLITEIEDEAGRREIDYREVFPQLG
ncbi:saccharopine dehydrogenase family protein [Archaeoglobus neptunius]|uniref:saccharopine dehydrogenase family protein n=1 Tax=Archaeoglobus neptunius TaxID=2798580 RepID=UPI001927AC7D|nr:saccharopine dehydrogenase family protein [Archaeoglobus neptunius]